MILLPLEYKKLVKKVRNASWRIAAVFEAIQMKFSNFRMWYFEWKSLINAQIQMQTMT